MKVDELKTLTEKWVFFIKNAENLNVIPHNVDDEGLKAAYEDADKHSWEKEELIAYDNSSIAEQDERGKITRAIQKGEIDKTYKVVYKCWTKKMGIEVIADITERTKFEVQEIIEQIKKGRRREVNKVQNDNFFDV